jgi:hypothetical protein
MRPSSIPAEIVTPAPKQIWGRVYGADPDAMPSQSPAWAEGLVASGDYRDESRFYRFADGTDAVLPLFASRGTPFSLARLWSPPTGWGYGGAISTAPLTAAHLATILQDLADARPFRLQLRPNPLHSTAWKEAAGPSWIRLSRSAHVLDLSGGFDRVWKERFKPRARTTINKAERADLEIEFGNDTRLVEEFYGLLVLSFARWAENDGRPVGIARWRGRQRDPIKRFLQMVRMPGSPCRVWVARQDGRAAAAILVLQDRNAHYTRGAMDEAIAGPSSAAYLLHKRAIEAACEAGCSHYHMGDTGARSSLAQFKTRFGAVEAPFIELRLERLPFSWVDRKARSLITQTLGRIHV